jgi:hypothetical protein
MLSHPPAPAPPAACLRGLPPSPVALSVAVSLDAGCALVVLSPGAGARLRPRPRVSNPPGAQAAPGEGVLFRGDHVVLERGGEVVWRSQRTFHPGHHGKVFTIISGAVASGNRLAYVVSRWSGRRPREHRLVFVTDGRHAERGLSAAGFPLGWTRRGLVTAEPTRRSVAFTTWQVDARRAAPALTLDTGEWAWDWATNRAYAVTGGRVVRTDGVSVTPLARLASLGVDRAATIVVSPLGHGMVELSSASRLAVLDRTGQVRVRAALPAGWRLAGGIASEPDGAVAFEASPVSTLPARSFRLYAALPGSRVRLLGSYSVTPTCSPHAVSLRGSTVLVSTDGLARVYDARGSRAPIDLEPAVKWLRARHRSGQVSLD